MRHDLPLALDSLRWTMINVDRGYITSSLCLWGCCRRRPFGWFIRSIVWTGLFIKHWRLASEKRQIRTTQRRSKVELRHYASRRHHRYNQYTLMLAGWLVGVSCFCCFGVVVITDIYSRFETMLGGNRRKGQGRSDAQADRWMPDSPLTLTSAPIRLNGLVLGFHCCFLAIYTYIYTRHRCHAIVVSNGYRRCSSGSYFEELSI